MRCVISVLGKDRAGIVAGISGVLAEKGASIDDINQTILVRPAARALKSWATSTELSVQWTDSGVSWYGDSAYGQLNASTRTYAYVALGVSA